MTVTAPDSPAGKPRSVWRRRSPSGLGPARPTPAPRALRAHPSPPLGQGLAGPEIGGGGGRDAQACPQSRADQASTSVVGVSTASTCPADRRRLHRPRSQVASLHAARLGPAPGPGCPRLAFDAGVFRKPDQDLQLRLGQAVGDCRFTSAFATKGSRNFRRWCPVPRPESRMGRSTR
jgi:hypothetical protein